MTKENTIEDDYIKLRYKTTDPTEAFNLFIKINLPDLYAHFIDDDENAGEFVREIISQAIEREKLKGQIAELKHLESGTDYWLDNGEVIFVRDRIEELQAQLEGNTTAKKGIEF